MQAQVQVHGGGVAAVCCARLLQANAIPFSIAPAQPRHHGMAVLLSASTQSLIMDLFCDPKLFRSLPVTRKRRVLWGADAEPITLPHSAIVMSEGDLLPKLWATVQNRQLEVQADAWRIVSQSCDPLMGEVMDFGSRTASISRVVLKSSGANDECWMESVRSGWHFLFGTGDHTAALVSVGAPAQVLLAESRMVAAQIETIGAASMAVASSPRILSQLAGEHWLACGTAAMTFDPVCGEGAGNAVREAILASAVIKAALRGEDGHALSRYYTARMTLGFLRHLEMCRGFYLTGGTSDFWREAVEDLQRGIRLMAGSVTVADASAYRLNGFELVTNLISHNR